MARSPRRTALFYDAPLSTPEDLALLKSMLLFFDDIAVFSMPAHAPHHPVLDPHLCAPLVERGLLQFVAPQAVTRSQTELVLRTTLHRAVVENAERCVAALTAGDWDSDVPRLRGRFAGQGLMKIDELTKTDGLMKFEEPPAPRDRDSLQLFRLLAQDGVLFPDESMGDEWTVDPGVASVANSILAQAVRAAAREQGWSVEPVATRRDEARVFTAIFQDAVENAGASDIVMSDLSAVTLDLSRVGLDEILAFRARHRAAFRGYLLDLQALLVPAPKPQDVADRKAALVQEAHRLRELQLRRWPKLGEGVSLAIIGATWTLARGDLLGALIGSIGSQPVPGGPTPVSAYTYMLRPTDVGDERVLAGHDPQ